VAVIAVLGRFVPVKRIERDRIRMIAIVERNHVMQTFGRDEVEDVIEDIGVGFDKGEAGTGRDVVRDHVEHERCLAFVGLADHVDRLAAVSVGKRHGLVLSFAHRCDERTNAKGWGRHKGIVAREDD
jgi:hypothetical protein